MQANGCHRSPLFKICALAVLLSSPTCSRAQQAAPALPPSAARQAMVDVQVMTDSLRDLEGQVRALNTELEQLREEQKSAQAEARALRDELADMRRGLAQHPGQASDDSAWRSPSPALDMAAVPSTPQTQGGRIEERLSRLEESQEVTAANVREQSQTKVESGSKYRLRLSGIILLNMFESRGTVDNLDIPVIALPPTPPSSPGAFGGTLRQSQISLDAFGPDVAGARTSASVTFDFAAGFIEAQNGATRPLVRLRTGTVRMDWTNTSIVAGQDGLFFVPLSPSSLASLAVPALAYAGDLWNWTPQIRIEHRILLTNQSHLLLQGGILDSLSGEAPKPDYERYPTWGERSGEPAFAGRVAWSRAAFGRDLTLGIGGYYGRQNWGFGRDVDAWAGTVDMDLPLGKLFQLSAAFYRGRSVGGLGGGIGQSILTGGEFLNPTSLVRGLDSMGGWAQLKLKLLANFEVNGALGEDNPFASELRSFPNSPAYYGLLLTRNLSPLANFIYQPRSDLLFSAEYRRLETSIVNMSAQKANLVDLSLGYTF